MAKAKAGPLHCDRPEFAGCYNARLVCFTSTKYKQFNSNFKGFRKAQLYFSIQRSDTK